VSRGTAGREIAVEAAFNNARWCDSVCRTHGARPAFRDDAWTTPRRSPPMYPDAVTLRPVVNADALLGRVDAAPGCSVKDSFAALDLAGAGFDVLFEAEWIHRPPGPAAESPGHRWSRVTTAGALRLWAAGHGGADVFRSELLADPAVAVLLATDRSGAVVAGAAANRSRDVVGLSNVFVHSEDVDEVWAGAVTSVAECFPGLPVVGYEAGEDLATARRAGFATVGPLRVWLRPE
jgi:hypothetical protein